MHRPTRLKVPDVNPNLTCILCGGYFVDATTIIECLHSFCKSCIVKYLDGNKYCPICDVQVHKTKPLQNIRSDKTLQDIVYKLAPGVFQSEMKRRREFYKGHPEAGQTSQEDRGEVAEHRLIYSPDEFISLSLEYGYGLSNQLPEADGSKKPEKSEDDKACSRRYLQCPAAVTVNHLKKFVTQKYGLPAHLEVDIMYDDDSLSEEYTLMDIAYIYTWRRTGPMRLRFQFNLKTNKRLKTSHPAVPETSEKVQSESPITPMDVDPPKNTQTPNSGSVDDDHKDLCPMHLKCVQQAKAMKTLEQNTTLTETSKAEGKKGSKNQQPKSTEGDSKTGKLNPIQIPKSPIRTVPPLLLSPKSPPINATVPSVTVVTNPTTKTKEIKVKEHKKKSQKSKEHKSSSKHKDAAKCSELMRIKEFLKMQERESHRSHKSHHKRDPNKVKDSQKFKEKTKEVPKLKVTSKLKDFCKNKGSFDGEMPSAAIKFKEMPKLKDDDKKADVYTFNETYCKGNSPKDEVRVKEHHKGKDHHKNKEKKKDKQRRSSSSSGPLSPPIDALVFKPVEPTSPVQTTSVEKSLPIPVTSLESPMKDDSETTSKKLSFPMTTLVIPGYTVSGSKASVTKSLPSSPVYSSLASPEASSLFSDMPKEPSRPASTPANLTADVPKPVVLVDRLEKEKDDGMDTPDETDSGRGSTDSCSRTEARSSCDDDMGSPNPASNLSPDVPEKPKPEKTVASPPPLVASPKLPEPPVAAVGTTTGTNQQIPKVFLSPPKHLSPQHHQHHHNHPLQASPTIHYLKAPKQPKAKSPLHPPMVPPVIISSASNTRVMAVEDLRSKPALISQPMILTVPPKPEHQKDDFGALDLSVSNRQDRPSPAQHSRPKHVANPPVLDNKHRHVTCLAAPKYPSYKSTPTTIPNYISKNVSSPSSSSTGMYNKKSDGNRFHRGKTLTVINPDPTSQHPKLVIKNIDVRPNEYHGHHGHHNHHHHHRQ